ncbi:MAG: hypothetical protein KF691_07440 [Phycisphaeraceae bacterium]|nr:hypothetical protein [Phycisphaeraceae bacterium]
MRAQASESAPANVGRQILELQGRLETAMAPLVKRAEVFHQAKANADEASEAAARLEEDAKRSNDADTRNAARILRKRAVRKLAAADQLHGSARDEDFVAQKRAAQIEMQLLGIMEAMGRHNILLGQIGRCQWVSARVRRRLVELSVIDLPSSTKGIS